MNKEKNQKTDDLMQLLVVEHAQNHMNTTFVFEVSAPRVAVNELDRLLLDLHDWVTGLETRISEFKLESEVSKIHHSGVGMPVYVSREMFELFEWSRKAFEWSGGAFDPSFRSSEGQSFKDRFTVNHSSQSIIKNLNGARLGFGAIGKGYALDRIAMELLRRGFKNFRLSSGGSSIVLSGQETPDQPWKMGLAWKKESGRLMGQEWSLRKIDRKDPIFIGVSGSMEQGDHIKGFSSTRSENRPLSVMVTAESAALADAYSTAIYVNPALGEKLIDEPLLIVDNQERLLTNQSFSKTFEWG